MYIAPSHQASLMKLLQGIFRKNKEGQGNKVQNTTKDRQIKYALLAIESTLEGLYDTINAILINA